MVLKLGRTRPSMQPHGAPQAGRAGYPRIQDTDSSPLAQGVLGLGFEAKPRGKCGAPRALTTCGLDDAWRLMGRGRLHFPMPSRLLFNLTDQCGMQKIIMARGRGGRRLASLGYKCGGGAEPPRHLSFVFLSPASSPSLSCFHGAAEEVFGGREGESF